MENRKTVALRWRAKCARMKPAKQRREMRMRMVKALKKYWTYYLLLLPAIAYVAIFNYGPPV